jgi:hypothetical protein
MAEAEPAEIGEGKTATGGGHVRQGRRALVTVVGSVGECTNADAVEDDPDSPARQGGGHHGKAPQSFMSGSRR